MNTPSSNRPNAILSREEIRAIYDQGSEAIIGFVEKLLAIIPEQSKQIELLTARVQELEARLRKDSHNSGKPPSSDGLRKKPAPNAFVQCATCLTGPKASVQKGTSQAAVNPAIRVQRCGCQIIPIMRSTILL